MALLQLAEPGASTAPHQHRLAVGIDLGTTNSLAASVIGGEAKVLPDSLGRALLPSVVRYARGAPPVVGHDAKAQQAQDPANTIASVKRLMGRTRSEVGVHTPYALVDTPGMVSVRTDDATRSPVEVSAAILAALRERAEATLGGTLAGAVVTVPAYFDDAQRQATKDAARLAGLDVLRLLNEPTAAAIAYGLDRQPEGLFAVYDLGGGTFDISLLRLTRGVFEVLATGGDSALGGDDFDHAIVQWLLDVETTRMPPLASDLAALLPLARAAKETLTTQDSVRLRHTLASTGREIDRILTRDTFEVLTQALVARTLRATRKALRDAKVEPKDVDGVVLVGGSTRMPAVRRAVEQCFGKRPLTDIDPDQVVAVGAAIQADVLAGNRPGAQWLLLDVCPLSVGLETMGGLAEKIIPRNSTLPVARAQEFTTFRDGQTAMEIHVVQGERELVAECRSLARFVLRGIPPMVAGAARIRVTFAIDADGLLAVSAREVTSGVEARVEVKPSYGLDDGAIARMLEDGQRAASADAKARIAREAQVDARRLLDATEAALAADGAALLSPPERAAIEACVFALADVLVQGDTAALPALKAATAALNAATAEFAARRMNAGIGRALTGTRIDALA